MFWNIVPLIVFIITISIWKYKDAKKEDKEDRVGFGFIVLISAIMASIVWIICLSIGQSISPDIRPHAKVDKEHPIYLHSLGSDNTLNGEIHGGYFLFAGSVSGKVSEEDTYHYFFFPNGINGGATSGNIAQDKVLVFEDTEENPYYLKYFVECPPDRKQGFFIFDNCPQYLSNTKTQYVYQFHIPAGSIFQGYSIQP